MSTPPVGRQFDLWGNAAPEEPEAAPEAPRAALAGKSKQAARAIMASDSLRERDEAIGLQSSSRLQLHSQGSDGLPKRGEVGTATIPGMAMMDSGKATPGWAKFHTLRYAPRMQGDLAEIPIVHLKDENVVRATQPTVSTQRIHQLINDPSTGVNPRFPATSPSNLPVVFEHKPGTTPNVTDGHHRISAALVKNNTPGQQMEMFTPVRKFTPAHEAATRTAEVKLDSAITAAQSKHTPHMPGKSLNSPKDPSRKMSAKAAKSVASDMGGDSRFDRFK